MNHALSSRRRQANLARDAGRRLETLSEISRVLSGILDPDALYDAMDEQVRKLLPVDCFAIELLDPIGDTVTLPYFRVGGIVIRDVSTPGEDAAGGRLALDVIKQGSPRLFRMHQEMSEFAGPHSPPPLEDGPEQSVMIVPLSTGNRTIGAITVRAPGPAAYDKEDLETVSVIASQAAVAIENAHLYARSLDSHAQTEALLHVARALNSSHDLPSALEAILVSMRDVTPFAYAAIMLPDHAAGTLDIMGSISPDAEDIQLSGLIPTLKIPFGQGISGKAFETGAPVVVPDVRTFAGFVDHGLHGVLSEAAVPLKRGETVVGVLDVGREGIDAFSPEDLDLLSLFASQAAIAIENARLFSEQRQRVDEMQTIQSIIQKITSQEDPAGIATVIMRELKQLIGYFECRIYLLQDDGETLMSLGNDPDAPGVMRPPLRLGEGFAGWVALHGVPDRVSSSHSDLRLLNAESDRQRSTSVIGAPLLYEDRIRGAITLSKFGVDQFDAHALRLLEIIAGQAAVALDRARVYHELRMEAITDPVVKLSNRRYLMQRFKEERARAIRSGRPLACLMMDIDDFKQVNDTYGHDAGDAVLRELAMVIRRQVREEDIAARYGGEEFCVLLPEAAAVEAASVAERLRETIAQHPLPGGAGTSRVTVSIGLSLLCDGDRNTEVFSRADAAMYAAKMAGGNQIRIAAH
jgi:diguanylate cyclase (GGDEF)-like protein